MVKRLKLNEKTLREAEPKPGVSYQIFDTEVIGFAARVQASGARTFTIDYRHAGRQRRMTIGRWPEWSVTAARERAKELRRAIDEGQDPLAARDEWRGAPRVTDMIDRYIAEHLPKLAKTNAGDQVSMLKKMVEPAWGNRLVTEITKSDVAKFLDFVAEGRPRPCKAKPNNRARKLQGHKPTPIRANRMGEVLRKMFTLAVEWEWRTDNPAQGFHRRIEHARERFLSPEELTRLATSGGPFNINLFCHRQEAPDPAAQARWLQRLAPYYDEYGVHDTAGTAAPSRAPFNAEHAAMVRGRK
jgi:hypothetical protein